MLNQHILIVEDEQDLAGILKDYLIREGFAVDILCDGSEALERLLAVPPDLLILDLMLPGVDGLSILREVRKKSLLPVIVVTAKVEEIDRLLGLELGADDYICKPYSPREVVLRVKTVLRRSARLQELAKPLQNIQIDSDGWTVTLGGHRLDLTPKEFRLLDVLASKPGRVFSRAQLLDKLYEDDFEISERAVDSHLKNLRRKIGEVVPGYDPIRSIYGVGFVFEPDP
ncbi:MAG: transcriptional regulatory protein BaeR [Pseudomonadota bacterium]|jgi:two-component system response regulator BaeR